MNKITQTALNRKALINYAKKNGVIKAAIHYRAYRRHIYRWMKRYDGTLKSLEDRSHRPRSHPNQYRPEEIKLIDDLRRRNPNAGLVVIWVKLKQRGYSRSNSGLYRFLKIRNQMAVKLPNPKYVPKPYEQMTYPSQCVQIDVKYVPASCLVGEAVIDGSYYQFTFIDEYSRFRYLEAFKDHSSYSAAQFIQHCAKKFPFNIECVQTRQRFRVHEPDEQLEAGRTAQAKSYMWLYRTTGDTEYPIVLYEYQLGRGQEYSKTFLDGFAGYLKTDGLPATMEWTARSAKR